MTAWPQVVLGTLLFAQFVSFLVKDGKNATSSFDLSTSIAATLIVIGVQVFLLWAGGFWAPLLAQ